MAGTTVHTLENQQLLEQVERESAAAARQLAETAHLRKGQLVVIGCSTSEVVGHQVGSWSTPEVADAIFRGLDSVFGPMGVYMAAQCCEHLNRALIVEYEAVPGGRSSMWCPSPGRAAPSLPPLTRRFGILWRWRRSGQTQDWTSAAPSSGCT